MLVIKRIIFHPKAREAIRDLPDQIKDELGQALFLLQQGYKLCTALARAMPSVAQGIEELRIEGRDGVTERSTYRERVMVLWCYMSSRRRPRKHLPSTSNWDESV